MPARFPQFSGCSILIVVLKRTFEYCEGYIAAVISLTAFSLSMFVSPFSKWRGLSGMCGTFTMRGVNIFLPASARTYTFLKDFASIGKLIECGFIVLVHDTFADIHSHKRLGVFFCQILKGKEAL